MTKKEKRLIAYIDAKIKNLRNIYGYDNKDKFGPGEIYAWWSLKEMLKDKKHFEEIVSIYINPDNTEKP